MADRNLDILQKHDHEVSVAKNEGDKESDGWALFNLGIYYDDTADFEQAIKNYTEALRIFKKIENRAGEGKTYGNLGNVYRRMGNFQQAIEYHKKDISIAIEVGDRVWEGEAYGNLGNTYGETGNFQQAVEYHKKDLSIAKERKDRASEGKTYGNLGIVYGRKGNFQQAIEYLKKELSIAIEVEDRVWEGEAYGNLGIAYGHTGNFQQAIEYHKKELSIAKERGDRAREGKAYGNLGNACRCLGNFQEAMDYHEKDLGIARDVGDRAQEGRALGNLGIVYDCLSNFNQAIEYHKQSLSIAKEVGDRATEGNTYCNLGNAYFGLGNFKQAIQYYKQYLIIAEEVNDMAGKGKCYCNLGNAFHSIGNFRKAMKYHEQDLSIAKEIGDRNGEGVAYGNLGNDYDSLGNIEQAIKCHKRRLSIAIELRDRAGEGRACGNLGNVYNTLGNFQQGIEYLNRHLTIAKEIGDRKGEGNAYGNLGNAYYSMGNLENATRFNELFLNITKGTKDPIGQGMACHALGLIHDVSGSLSHAIEYYRLSMKHFDQTRRLLQSEDALKISFRDTKQRTYRALWTALVKNGEVDKALYAAEQGRAQAMTDILKGRYGVDEETSSEVTTKEAISAVLENLPLQVIFTALEGSTISFWLLSKGSEIFFRQKKIENENAESLMKTTFEQIRAGAFVHCENRSLDRQRNTSPCLREAVQESPPSLRLSVNCLQPLYDVLVSPIADLFNSDDLVFVPDGPFCLVPYSALSESVRIRTVPSLTALKVITGAPDDFSSKSKALLVGDPCLKEVTYNGEPIEQLPCAKTEVEMIGELLQTTPLTGSNATKNEVLKRMTSVALIHIAAHGDSEFGEIALAPNPDRTSQIPEKDDFLLTMSDVHAIRLKARLVVLSCCHSGQGELKSEGVVGIARAFLCAGARSVLVSLWAIDDDATLLFMKFFYQHLADRKSASLALHHAMKSLRETKKYSAVIYWAPFVLIGDDVTFEFGQDDVEKNENV